MPLAGAWQTRAPEPCDGAPRRPGGDEDERCCRSITSILVPQRPARNTFVQDVSFAIESGVLCLLCGRVRQSARPRSSLPAGLHNPPSGGRILFERRAASWRPFARDLPLAAPPAPSISFQNPFGRSPRQQGRSSIERPCGVALCPREARHGLWRALDRAAGRAGLGDRFPIELVRRRAPSLRCPALVRPSLRLLDLRPEGDLGPTCRCRAPTGAAAELQRDLRLIMLFITHNLAPSPVFGRQRLVMDRGLLCESGTVAQVLNTGRPYSKPTSC